MESATILQTPILLSKKMWLKEFKEYHKLDTYGEAIEKIIEVYKRSLMTPTQIDAASPSEMPNAEWVIERALNVLHGVEMGDDE
jgi:hypothetical protein